MRVPASLPALISPPHHCMSEIEIRAVVPLSFMGVMGGGLKECLRSNKRAKSGCRSRRLSGWCSEEMRQCYERERKIWVCGHGA